jgi:predicted permease
MALVETLVSAVLPVLSIAAIGYMLATVRDVDVEPLSTVSLYVLLPALVFHSLVTSEVSTQVTVVAFVGVFLFVSIMLLLSELASRVLDIDGSLRNALVLTAIFPNVGNYGLPLADFAFGPTGREIAVIFIIGQSILMYTLGTFVASRRTDRTTGTAVSQIFYLPLIYAVIAALSLRGLGWVPPQDLAIMKAIALTGDATIPVMLLILGMELATLRRNAELGRLVQASTLVLLIGPIVAFGVATVTGLPPNVRNPFVLLGAMPAAITPLLLLIEFGDEGSRDSIEFAGSVIFITTVLSVGTLSALILLL